MGLLAQNPSQPAAWPKPACDLGYLWKIWRISAVQQSSVEFALT
eukprot:COSAG01_NODE_235_length_20918_cov_41.045086_9_plen_44_part_00